MRIALAARASRLSRLQARLAAEALRKAGRKFGLPVRVAFVPVETKGDRTQRAWTSLPRLAAAGAGLFTREVEAALLEGRADLAVHSLKDLPLTPPEGLVLAAVLRRTEARDALLVRAGMKPSLAALPRGARVGTSSPRRKALLLHHRRDLQVVPLRGNVPTRLSRVRGRSADLDAAVLSAAGLLRLRVARSAWAPLSPRDFPPAPGQGAIALEARADAPKELLRLLAAVNHTPTRRAVEAERAVLAAAGGGCHLPLGAWARGGWIGAAADLGKGLRFAEGRTPASVARQLYEK